jgi:hypothetical protein
VAAAGAGDVAGEFDARDRVGERVAGDDEPGAVALLVVPELPMLAGRVVALVDVGVEALGRVRREAVGRSMSEASPR